MGKQVHGLSFPAIRIPAGAWKRVPNGDGFYVYASETAARHCDAGKLVVVKILGKAILFPGLSELELPEHEPGGLFFGPIVLLPEFPRRRTVEAAVGTD